MKHRPPTPKSAKARSLGATVEQPELLADDPNRPSTPNINLPPPLPSAAGSTPEISPAPDRSSNGLLVTPAPEITPTAPPVESAKTPEAESDSVSPFSFLSATHAQTSPAKPKTGTKGASEIASILRAAMTTDAEQKLIEPPAPEKKKTRRMTPPPLPLISPQKSQPLPALALLSAPVSPSMTNHVSDKSATTEQPTRAMVTQPSDKTTAMPVAENAAFLIQTRGLVKQYAGRRVVNGVDIHVRAGEVVGLLGKNGAGKTTTFYMIVGLVPPTEGHVYLGDADVTRMPMYRRARRGIGYLPQEESIFRKLTVEENLLAILETLPLTEEERDARCDELLKDFGLEHVRENVAITLSGGEKRRVTIARALVTSPSLLLLDEPFAGVDPMAVHDIQEIILKLRNKGMGVLLTDHSVRETLSVVDRAYIIDEGRVLSEGSKEFLLNDPIAREIYLGHRFSM